MNKIQEILKSNGAKTIARAFVCYLLYNLSIVQLATYAIAITGLIAYGLNCLVKAGIINADACPEKITVNGEKFKNPWLLFIKLFDWVVGHKATSQA